jgi:5,10-methylenetetrahydromethanopterin reductase
MQFSVYGQLPSYRAMLDREGAAGPADVAIAGDESIVAKEIARVADAGGTELLAVPFGNASEVTRTVEVLAELNV